MTDYQRGYRDACTLVAKQLRSATTRVQVEAEKHAERGGEAEAKVLSGLAAVLGTHAGAVEKLGENAPEEEK